MPLLLKKKFMTKMQRLLLKVVHYPRHFKNVLDALLGQNGTILTYGPTTPGGHIPCKGAPMMGVLKAPILFNY